MAGIKFLTFFIIIAMVFIVSASPKQDICDAINLTETICDVWWNHHNLTYLENFTMNVTVKYIINEYTDEHILKNYSYYNCSLCNCTYIYNYTTAVGTYTKWELVNESLDIPDIKIKNEIPLGWKITIIITGILLFMLIMFILYMVKNG